MQEITKIPAKVQCSDSSVEVYEYEYGFAMTAEHLGRKLGYESTAKSTSNLFNRHKVALEPHMFFITTVKNPLGGRQRSS